MESSVKRADELREVQLGGLFDVFAKEPCMLEAMTAKEEMQDNRRHLPSVNTSLAASFENRGLACYELHAWCVGAAQTL